MCATAALFRVWPLFQTRSPPHTPAHVRPPTHSLTRGEGGGAFFPDLERDRKCFGEDDGKCKTWARGAGGYSTTLYLLYGWLD